MHALERYAGRVAAFARYRPAGIGAGAFTPSELGIACYGPASGQLVEAREAALAAIIAANQAAIRAKVTASDEDITAAERAVGEARRLQRLYEGLGGEQAPEDLTAAQEMYLGRGRAAGAAPPYPTAGGIGIGDAPLIANGVRALRPTERLASTIGPGQAGDDMPLGELVRHAIDGRWPGGRSPIQAQQSIGTPGAGGYLVPEITSTRIIDLARAQARVSQAGALTIPMTSSTLKVPKVLSGGSAEWKAENAAVSTIDDLEFDVVTLTAKSIVGIAKLSVELVEDAQDPTGLVERELSAALATEIDRVALRGTGVAPEPLGLLSSDDVSVSDFSSAALTSYGHFSAAVEAIWRRNLDPNAVIWAVGIAGQLDRLTDTTGQPLRMPPSIQALNRLVTNQAADGEAYVGAWENLFLGMRTDIVIEASRQAADSAGSAFRNLQVWVRAYARVDVGIARPEAFRVLTSLGTAFSS